MTHSQRRLLLVVLGTCFIAVLGAMYVHKPPNPDHGIFDYIGWIGSMGGRYYVDVAEQNFPGEMLLHELAIRVFGPKYWAYRAVDFGVLILGAIALYRLLQRAGFGVGSLFGAGCYLAGYVSSNAWMAGQRDVVAANLLLVCGYLFVRRLNGGSCFFSVLTGMMFFMAVLLRPTYLLYAAELLFIDLWLRRQTSRRLVSSLLDVAIVAGVVMLCVGVLVGRGLVVHSFSAFREQGILFNLQAYSEGHSRLDTLSKIGNAAANYGWYVPAVIVSLSMRPAKHRREPSMLVLVGLLILAPVSALVQNKGFGYHLGALLPPVFGFGGAAVWMAIHSTLKRHQHRTRDVAIVVCAAILVVAGLLKQSRSLAPQIRYLIGRESFSNMMHRENGGQDGFTWDNMFAASEYIRRTTAPNETILVWARPVGLHVLALRRSPTRFITHGMLQLAMPPFERAAEWQNEFTEALQRRPPSLVFIEAKESQLKFGLAPETNENVIVATLRKTIATRYEPAEKFGSLQAYRLVM